MILRLIKRRTLIFATLISLFLGALLMVFNLRDASIVGITELAVISLFITLTYPVQKLNIFQLAIQIQFAAFYVLPTLSYLIFGYTFFFEEENYGLIKPAILYCTVVSCITYVLSFYAIRVCARFGLGSVERVFDNLISKTSRQRYEKASLAAFLVISTLMVVLAMRGGQSLDATLRNYVATFISRFLSPLFLLCVLFSLVQVRQSKPQIKSFTLLLGVYVLGGTLIGSRGAVLSLLFIMTFLLGVLLKARPEVGLWFRGKTRLIGLLLISASVLAPCTFFVGTYVRSIQSTDSHTRVEMLDVASLVDRITQRLSATEFYALIVQANRGHDQIKHFHPQLQTKHLSLEAQFKNLINNLVPGGIWGAKQLVTLLHPVIYLGYKEEFVNRYYQSFPFTLEGYLTAKNGENTFVVISLTVLFLVLAAISLSLALGFLTRIPFVRPFVPAIYLFSGFWIMRVRYFFGWDHFFLTLFQDIVSIALSVLVIRVFAVIRIQKIPRVPYLAISAR